MHIFPNPVTYTIYGAAAFIQQLAASHSAWSMVDISTHYFATNSAEITSARNLQTSTASQCTKYPGQPLSIALQARVQNSYSAPHVCLQVGYQISHTRIISTISILASWCFLLFDVLDLLVSVFKVSAGSTLGYCDYIINYRSYVSFAL